MHYNTRTMFTTKIMKKLAIMKKMQKNCTERNEKKYRKKIYLFLASLGMLQCLTMLVQW
jgi:hypothetical protein